jgi:hypothetical protein
MRRERMITAVAALFVVVLLAAAGANAGTKAPLFSKSATQQGYGGVAPTVKPPKPHISVAGTTHSSSNAAPLAAGHSGTLPFTGAQLGLFVALGLVLLAGGVVLHRAGRGRSRA